MADDGVQLEELLFTMSWEDPELDRRAFALEPGARIATVASGGCNALAFLLDDPREVFAFDYNATQVYVAELKRLAVRDLNDDELFEFLGIRESSRRAALLARLTPALPAAARAWCEAQPWLVDNGLLNGGRYERFVGLFQRLLRLIHGRRRIEALFIPRERDERAAFYDAEWDTWAWRLLFRLFFNKTVLARRGLSPEYFAHDDGTQSFAESFRTRTAHVLRDLPVHDNPFLSQYTLGRYVALPDYLRPENLPIIRDRIDRLRIEVGDVRTVFDDFGPDAFDAICLSNVFELMSEAETRDILPRVAHGLRPGGRMTLRNLMVPRAASPEHESLLELDADLSRELLNDDRSFVYRSVQVYTRRAPEVS